eukprot:8212472-Ditylum_brightwellii.AAC.1
MQEQYADKGDEDVRPNTVSFTCVIDAWAKKSGEVPGAARRAEELLGMMHKLHDESLRSSESAEKNRIRKDFRDINIAAVVQPNARSYASVIDAWSRSGEDGAAQHAERILKRMQHLHRRRDNDHDTNNDHGINTDNASSQRGNHHSQYNRYVEPNT